MLKKLANASESVVNERLKDLCAKHGAQVNMKVRVADVLPVEDSGVPDVEFGFALRAHFDFVVTDKDHVPLFAVGFCQSSCVAG